MDLLAISWYKITVYTVHYEEGAVKVHSLHHGVIISGRLHHDVIIKVDISGRLETFPASLCYHKG